VHVNLGDRKRVCLGVCVCVCVFVFVNVKSNNSRMNECQGARLQHLQHIKHMKIEVDGLRRVERCGAVRSVVSGEEMVFTRVIYVDCVVCVCARVSE